MAGERELTSYDIERRADAEAKVIRANARMVFAEARKIEALKTVDTAKLRVWSKANRPVDTDKRHYVFLTLWVTQILGWAFLMMVFKRSVWPR